MRIFLAAMALILMSCGSILAASQADWNACTQAGFHPDIGIPACTAFANASDRGLRAKVR
jgi:hypothetical protein